MERCVGGVSGGTDAERRPPRQVRDDAADLPHAPDRSRAEVPRAATGGPILVGLPRAQTRDHYSQLPTGYTIGMKTAVSLPNEVFDGAERYAKRTRKSRSQLYAEALSEYLARHAPDEVTEDMNAVVRRLGKSSADPFVEAATRRALRKVEW